MNPKGRSLPHLRGIASQIEIVTRYQTDNVPNRHSLLDMNALSIKRTLPSTISMHPSRSNSVRTAFVTLDACSSSSMQTGRSEAGKLYIAHFTPVYGIHYTIP